MPEPIDSFTSVSSIPQQPNVLVNSSSVVGYSYDNTNYILDVWYKNSKGADSIYRYFMVYPNIVSSIFDSGGSYGKNAKANLKGLMFNKLR
jgi:hypothetical protein